MTWQELADFINNQMPECNKNQQVCVWDAGFNDVSGGKWIDCFDIEPYDADEEPNVDNFYSIVANTDDNGWWC